MNTSLQRSVVLDGVDEAAWQLRAYEQIVGFEAKTGGRIDAHIAQTVIEYYQALAKYYEMQYQQLSRQAEAAEQIE